MVPPNNQNDFPLFVDDTLCASLEGTQGYACFNRVWRDGRWALETLSTINREPVGTDYLALMMARMMGRLTDDECNEAIRQLQETNVIIEKARYIGLFHDDRKI